MRMTMTDSSTCGVGIVTDETSRGNNLKNVGSRRMNTSKYVTVAIQDPSRRKYEDAQREGAQWKL